MEQNVLVIAGQMLIACDVNERVIHCTFSAG